MSVLSAIYGSFTRLIRNRFGSIAPMMAVGVAAAIPMGGLAVDYTYAWTAKRALQEAVDAALLAVGRQNPKSAAEIRTIAEAAFKSQLTGRYELKNAAITVRRAGPFAFDGTGAADVPMHFAGLFGAQTMRAEMDGRVEADVENVEVVLALDTTFSMTGSRISALRNASRNLVDYLMKGENTKVGVVPFARYVNIGLNRRNEPGFAIPADGRVCRKETRQEEREVNCRMETRSGGTCTRNVNCRTEVIKGQGNCTRETNCREENYTTTCPKFEERFVSRTCRRDGVNYECGQRERVQVGTERCTKQRRVCQRVTERCPDRTRQVCDREQFPCRDQRVRVCDRTRVNVQVDVCKNQKWHGCVGSRQPPLTASDAHAGVDIPGAMDIKCNTPLQPLTANVGELRSIISDMEVDDETYIPGGLSMGWAVLSNRIPFTQGNASPSRVTRALVLMTDGFNTVSKNQDDELHQGNDRDAADNLTNQLCTNIKADGVMVLTVAFEVTDSGIQTMLRNCASSPVHAFQAEDAEALEQVFMQIGAILTDLRLTR